MRKLTIDMSLWCSGVSDGEDILAMVAAQKEYRSSVMFCRRSGISKWLDGNDSWHLFMSICRARQTGQ